MSLLTAYGFVSVAVMLIAYTFEQKGRIWILVFAIGCLCSAVYGLLADTLPFAILEGIWAMVAFRKWLKA